MTDIHPGSAGGAAGLTPPQALDAERSILAAMMLDASAVGRAIENIESSSFYRSAHAKMFEALIALYNRNEAADLITVAEELRRRGDFEAAGGAAGLAQIMEYATTTANLEHHIKIVHGKAILRGLIKATNEIQQQCYSGQDETASLLDQAESRIFAITDQRIRQGFSTIGQLIMPTMTHIDQLFARKTQITGVPSGWDDLDKLTSGWQPGDLIILAGRPSMGKCVSWRTLVVNPRTGERTTIEECVRRRMPTVLGIDERGVVRETKVSHWIDSGVQPVFRVSTKLGRSIEVTGHHPFLTTDGWQPLHDLAVGDSVGVPRIVPAAGTDESWSLERVRLLARELRNELGQLQGLPTAVWTWGAERLRVFLTEMAGVEGANELNSKFASVRLAIAAEALGRDLQHAFLRLGVVMSMVRSGDGGWQLAGVELKGLRAADESTDAGYNAHSNRPIRRERLERYATALADPELALLASEDLFWDEIAAITPLGAMQVYDLTVPDGANFLANDVCVHNTSAVMNMAENAAIRFNIPVAVFSLEMSKEQIALRLLCSQSEVSLQKVRTGYLGNEDWPRLTTGAGLLTQAPINIDDSAALSVLEIRAKCRRLKAENKLGLVIVDYLQLMRASGQVENRVQEISQISRGLKALAKELHVPIIALSQLSRAVEQRGGGGRPQLSDLRDSGCLTADSRVMRADTGAEVTMGELLASGERNIPVWTVDEAFRVVEGNMTHVFPSGVKEVFGMSLASGRTIKASANHPFLTLDGWRRLDQLEVGTNLGVASPRSVGDSSGSDAHARVASSVAVEAVPQVGVELSWDRIVSIQSLGEQPVFDATVEGTHNFIANGLVVHNSIEQDADVVMFVYREVVYKPDTAEPGKAQIIVAKQRNGPTDDVNLTFLRDCTKFVPYSAMMSGETDPGF